MNSKRGEIPVTPPERESQGCWYSPSIFLASSKTVPRPLSRFDTHLRWPPLTPLKVFDLDGTVNSLPILSAKSLVTQR